jgi:hypothetical protein
MSKKDDLINLIQEEFNQFKSLNYSNCIVPNSIPIVWFGNSERYFDSKRKIVTVSLNPSDNEFRLKKSDPYSTTYRFPSYSGSIISMYNAYNEYFSSGYSYGSWFKASFKAVLKGFEASHYDGADNTSLHTDIGSPYATNPTWSKLDPTFREILEPMGSASWHKLLKVLEPDIILYSASDSFESKIKFPQIGGWTQYNVNARRSLLSGKFQLSNNKSTSVLFQVQGRKPFLFTEISEKEKFIDYI